MSDAEPTRVVLVDDQNIIRAGLIALLEGDEAMPIRVVGEASDGAGVVALVRRTTPDVVLMDVRMPFVDGVQATTALRADPQCRDVPVIMVTTFDDEVRGALRAGADGYLLKDMDADRLRAAVRAAARGEPVFSPTITRRVMADAVAAPQYEPNPRIDELTSREQELLVAVAGGDDNATVAAALKLSPQTVRTYVSRLLTKLGASSRAQLVAIAHRSGRVHVTEHGHGEQVPRRLPQE